MNRHRAYSTRKLTVMALFVAIGTITARPGAGKGLSHAARHKCTGGRAVRSNTGFYSTPLLAQERFVLILPESPERGFLYKT